MNQRRSQDPREYELICNTKTLSLEDRRYLVHYAATWRSRKFLRWLRILVALTIAMTSLSWILLGGKTVTLPIAAINGYLTATILLSIHYHIAWAKEIALTKKGH